MSYDIHLYQPNGEAVWFDEAHGLKGGTYALGGTSRAWLNVTYNYAKHFYRVMGEKGIRSIYGMTARDSQPVLRAAIDALRDDETDDYWSATEGNARRALMDLLTLAEKAPPESVWNGD